MHLTQVWFCMKPTTPCAFLPLGNPLPKSHYALLVLKEPVPAWSLVCWLTGCRSHPFLPFQGYPVRAIFISFLFCGTAYTYEGKSLIIFFYKYIWILHNTSVLFSLVHFLPDILGKSLPLVIIKIPDLWLKGKITFGGNHVFKVLVTFSSKLPSYHILLNNGTNHCPL